MSEERTIAFVDLAGFTALTEVHGDSAAVELIDEFTATVRQAVDGIDATLVKTVGDAAMLAVCDPATALGVVRRVFEASYDTGAFLEPRAGLHHGPVIAREDDYFGATVNLAARVTGRAGSGEALGTGPVAEAAQALRVDTVALGAYRPRNILEPVELWAIELCPTHIDTSFDPVCHMRVSCHAAVGRIRHAGAEHWLCSLDCVRQFAADPDRYLTPGVADP